MRAYARRTLVFLAGLACLCLALETGLRVLGLVYRKNTYDFAVDTRVPAKDDFFILCLGDSWTYGLGAPPDKSYPRQLEEKLNRISDRHAIVINDGYAGDNTWQMREKLFKRLSASRLPDLVILMGGSANSWNFTGAADIAPSLSSFLRRHSRAFRLAGLLAENIRKTASAKKQSFLRSKLFTTQLEEDIATIRRRVPKGVQLPMLDNTTGIEPRDYRYWLDRIVGKPVAQLPLSQVTLCARNALALLLTAKEKDPLCCANVLLYLGQAFKIAGQYHRAALYCLEALKYGLIDSEIYQELSMIVAKQGDTNMALRFSLRRLCLCPTKDLLLISDILPYPERLRLLRETIERFSLPVSGELAAIVGMENPRQQILDWIQSDFRAMFAGLKNKQIPFFVMADFYTSSQDRDWQNIINLAKEFNAPYILTAALFPKNLNFEANLAGDHDHPNAKGYGFIADCVINEILKDKALLPDARATSPEPKETADN